jgi:ppGpp synthetase/RelA/SpoT-type nucleotidyltranferase
VLDLSALGEAKTDDSSDFTAINERDVVQPISFGYQSHHAQLAVLEPVIGPDKSFVPDEFPGQ